ncbi:MAG: spermidine synthase, partial [Candidatus Micrarchaeia archaeon]
MKLPPFITNALLGRTIAEIDEPGVTLKIVEKNGRRTLLYNNIVFSAIIKDSLYTHGYWDYFMPLPLLFENPSVMVIGLGGGTVPYQLETLYHNIRIDVIDIDPNMVSISKMFLPRDLKAKVIIGDGAEYIQKVENSYDLIILDTYSNSKIPGAFLADAFIKNAHKALKQNGILAINYALSSDNLPYFVDYTKRLESHFKVGIVSAYNLGNRIIVCMKGIEKEGLDKAVKGFGSSKIADDYIDMKML